MSEINKITNRSTNEDLILKRLNNSSTAFFDTSFIDVFIVFVCVFVHAMIICSYLDKVIPMFATFESASDIYIAVTSLLSAAILLMTRNVFKAIIPIEVSFLFMLGGYISIILPWSH